VADTLVQQDLGRVAYGPAFAEQSRRVDALIAAREAPDPGVPELGWLLLVEHDPVITVSRRPTAASNLIAGPAQLAAAGVEVCETDRGGDITYHGPGQLVVYPILDLNRLNLGLHAYMRLLEDAVIGTIARFGLAGEREPGATGVWVRGAADEPAAKIAAMGVRVRRWVSMHGLALNVTTDLSHFGLIVPCGLVGRRVTSLRELLGAACPGMPDVKGALAEELSARILAAAEAAKQKRA